MAPDQRTEHYSLDPAEQRGQRKDVTGRVDNVRETWMSDNDYEMVPNDDYENADEIDAITKGRC